MAVDPRTPCLIGVAQQTWRPEDGPAPEPLDQWEFVVRAAARDTGAPNLLAQLDSVQVVYCQSWQYDDPVGRLCSRLSVDPRHRVYSGIGGTTPQVLINHSALAILRGELDLGLVVGAEALATKRAAKRAGERPAWSFRDPERKPFPFEALPVDTEVAHEVFQAYLTFALFEVARRAARGLSVEEHRAGIGALLAPLTRVAAGNPHAWFPVERTPDELMTPTRDNRLVGWPYTKRTVAVMDVDMAAAVVVASSAAADRLGVPQDQRVYLRGWAYGTDCWTVAERADLSSSTAIRAVSAAALHAAGLELDEVSAFDLYSCFASSLAFGTDALGLAPDDPRDLSVTGGLPFAGGPASNYLLHAVTSMVQRLREQPGTGLLSGVGMHMTKHVYAAYSTEPRLPDPSGAVELASQLEAVPRHSVVDAWEGPATVATYTVEHGRDGAPIGGLLVVDVAEHARAYARVDDLALLEDAERRELVGQRVTLTTDGRRNTASW